MEEKRKLKKSVLIRQMKEAERELKEEMQGQWGSATASLNNVPTSPRKMRLMADLIRSKRVFEALNILEFQPQAAAKDLLLLLKSAIANWRNQNEKIDAEEADLYVAEVFVDSGRMLKRLRTAPQGRGYRVRKRSNHVTIVIDSLVDVTSEEISEQA
jgi:large subunit ribosomal protein L22